jgi:arylsulfatase
VDGKEAAKGRIDKTILGRFSADETFDTGEDTGSPVSDLYKSPFRFAGTNKKGEIDLAPEKLGAADREKLKKAHVLFRLTE